MKDVVAAEYKPKIFIASSHRSGSTHMGQTLCNLTGRTMDSGMVAFRKGFGADEHTFHPFMAQALMTRNDIIFHQHCKGTTVHQEILNSFGAYVLVTVRNIYDLALSSMERMNNGVHAPCVVSPPKWKDFSDHDKWLWAAHNLIPWNFQFAASWMMSDCNTLWVKYETYYADQIAGMKKILEFLRLPERSDKDIRKAADINVNLKVGKVGRGEATVPDDVRQIVERQYGIWGELEPHLRRVYE